MSKISRALISVSDKRGVVEFARGLAALGVEIVSTGGTGRALAEAGIKVVPVEAHTGSPEILGGRVKTLHTKIHGGILARRDDPAHRGEMEAHGVSPIDLVAVTLYPFEDTVANAACSLAEAIENIDIGGPTLIRAAAKNHAFVTVLTDPADYGPTLAEMRAAAGTVSPATRFRLAIKAFRLTARYDGAIADYLGSLDGGGNRRAFSDSLHFQAVKAQDLRYGENPHQAAAFYREDAVSQPSVAAARQRQGKELSFNNIVDADAALGLLSPGAGDARLLQTAAKREAARGPDAGAGSAAGQGDKAGAGRLPGAGPGHGPHRRAAVPRRHAKEPQHAGVPRARLRLEGVQARQVQRDRIFARGPGRRGRRRADEPRRCGQGRRHACGGPRPGRAGLGGRLRRLLPFS